MKKLHLLKSAFLLCALIAGSGSLWATDVTFDFADYKGKGTQSTGSEYTMVKSDVSITNSKFYCGSDASYAQFYASGTTTITPQVGVTITKIVLTTSASYNGFQSSGTFTASTGSVANTNSSTATWTGSATTEFTMTSSKQIRWTSIEVTYTKVDVPEHTATFSVNGATTSDDYKEGEDITFPADPEIDGLEFMGWTTAAIVGTQDTEPAVLVTEATMSTSDITYFAVFAKSSIDEGNVTKTITISTTGLPTSYDTSFSDYTLEGIAFKIKQMYKNGTKLQWHASDGTMYNTNALSKIQSIVLTYADGDSNKNFTLKVGASSNPSSGTSVTPSVSGSVYTFDCSSYNNDYFVLTNGTGAGYLESVAITYKGEVTVYSAYRTSIPTIAVSISSAKYATFSDEVARDFYASGITVYAATATASSVEFDEVTDGIVPANTGVVLYSETTKSDVAIPVATTDASYDFTDNEMVANVAVTNIAYAGEGSKKNYILANGGSGVGFYKAAVGGANLGAHKAYLSTATAAAARDFLGFEDNTTGIEKVEGIQQNVGEYYNLAGQRVANPTKGLYIVNGKKVIK